MIKVVIESVNISLKRVDFILSVSTSYQVTIKNINYFNSIAIVIVKEIDIYSNVFDFKERLETYV